jgi:glycosyltransferase involved in cell wall biosynthesis
MANNTITLCMITKNEEDFIRQCLASTRGLVDEIIIVDTGSTDKTVEVAKAFTDKIFNFTWTNDFSAARNESLKHATKDWVLVLDADEQLSPQDHIHLRDMLKENGEKYDGFALEQRNYTNRTNTPRFHSLPQGSKDGKNFLGYDPVKAIRLFKNKKEIQFKHAIHENVYDSITEHEGKILVTNIPIHHYREQKSAEDTLEKAKAYLKTLQEQVKKNPEDTKAQYELGQLYLNMERLDEAQEALTKVQEQDKEGLYSDGGFLNTFLATLFLKQGKLRDAEKYFIEELKLKPDNRNAYLKLASTFLLTARQEQDAEKRKGQLNKALRVMKQAIDKGIQDVSTYNIVGYVFMMQEKVKEAIQSFMQGKKVSRGHSKDLEQLNNNLAQAFLSQQMNSRAIQLYEECVKEHPTVLSYPVNLSQIYAQLGEFDKAIMLAEKAKELDQGKNNLEQFIAQLKKLKEKGITEQKEQSDQEQTH